MNIAVKVIAGAKKREMRLEGDRLKVKVPARAVDGKANEAVIAFIAETFGLKKHQVAIVAGEKETRKLVSIPIEEQEFKRVVQTLG